MLSKFLPASQILEEELDEEEKAAFYLVLLRIERFIVDSRAATVQQVRIIRLDLHIQNEFAWPSSSTYASPLPLSCRDEESYQHRPPSASQQQ